MGVDQGAKLVKGLGREQWESGSPSQVVQTAKGRTKTRGVVNSIQDRALQPLPWEVAILTTRPVMAKLLEQAGGQEREDWWVSPMDLSRDRGHPVHGQQAKMESLQWVGWDRETKLGETSA